MKQKKTALLLLLSFWTSLNVFAQENFKETTLVKNIISALQNENDNKVIESLATKEDVLYLIPLVRSGRPTEKVPEVNNILAGFKKGASEDFKEIIRKGKSFGVQWEDTELQEIRYDRDPDDKIAIERGHIILVCNSNAVSFEVILRKSLKIKDNWRLMDRMKFRLL